MLACHQRPRLECTLPEKPKRSSASDGSSLKMLRAPTRMRVPPNRPLRGSWYWTQRLWVSHPSTIQYRSESKKVALVS